MQTHELAVPLIAQQTSYWCWAASAQMVLVYYGAKEYAAAAKQCEIASVNGVDCCDSAHCDDPGCSAGDAEQAFAKLAPKHEVPLKKYLSNETITFESICEQIDAKHPIIAVWVFHYDDNGQPATGLHSIVVVGYQIVDDQRFVIINNPAPVGSGSSCAISYECFSKQYVSELFCAIEPQYVTSAAPTAAIPAKRQAPQLDELQRLAVQRIRARPADVHRVGEPLRVVELGGLQKRKRETSHLIYPVLTRHDHVLTTFELSRDRPATGNDDPTWNLCCVGGDELYHRLDDARRAHAARARVEPSDYFAVHEPTLGLWFVAVERDERIALIPVSDVREARLSAGIELAFEELLGKVQPLRRARSI